MSPRVLVVEESLPYRRLLREALTSFCDCEVDDTPSPEAGFEMALRREYSLFMFAITLQPFPGDVLDRLLSKAYPLAHRERHTAPPILYLLRSDQIQSFHSLQRDARVRGQMTFPPRIDQLLALTQSLLPPHPAS